MSRVGSTPRQGYFRPGAEAQNDRGLRMRWRGATIGELALVPVLELETGKSRMNMCAARSVSPGVVRSLKQTTQRWRRSPLQRQLGFTTISTALK
jgi:hypothetical protein